MRKNVAIAFALLLFPLLAAQQLYIPPFTLPATTCTNQFIRSIAAATGVGTCASIAAGDFPVLTGDVTTPGGSLATTLAASARLKSKRIQITRDLTVATGNVAYTGMGFQPTTCIGFGDAGTSITQYTTVIGVVDSAGSNANLTAVTAGLVLDTAFLRFYDATGASSQSATIASFDADGLTLTWTKTGTPTGTATVSLMCYR